MDEKKKHRWGPATGKPRKCRDCGVWSRVRPGTVGTLEYRQNRGEAWNKRIPCVPPLRSKRLGLG